MTIFQRQDKTSFSFTADRLTKLTPPLSGEATYHDTGVDGLCIRVRPSGAAAYIVRYRLPGSPRSRRITLGAIDVMSIAEARTRAREAILSARKGVDPLEERKAAARSLSEARYAVTVAQLIDEHERAQRSAGIASATTAARSMRAELKNVLDLPASNVTRHDLTSIFAKVRAGIPGHVKPRPGLEPTLRAHIHGLLAYGQNERASR